jgi:MFS family permease
MSLFARLIPQWPERTLPFLSLRGEERSTFRLHITSAVIGAVAAGVMLNHDYIATRGLHATVWQITLLTMIWPVSNLFSVFASHWLERKGSYFRTIMIAGILCRMPIAFMCISSSVNMMLILLVFYFASNSVVIPGQNAVIRHRYGEGRRATLFGWGMSAFTLFSLPASMIAGAMLDADFQFYRILFVVEGVFGVGHALLIAMMARGMKLDKGYEYPEGPGFFRRLFTVFSKDREFARFEAYFMLYGVGFMVVLPAIPFFASDVLGLSYEQYAVSKGVIGQLGILLLGPFMGAKVDRIHPFRFTGIMSIILGFYPLALMAGGIFPDMGRVFFYTAYAIFAIGIAGVTISWNMSSLYFAPEGQTATYQGLHISMTAIRGLFAPILGNLIITYSGYTDTFLVSAGCFFTAGLLHLRRHQQREAEGLETKEEPGIRPGSPMKTAQRSEVDTDGQ